MQDVILFATAAEFQEREAYVPALKATHGELDRIIGKYELSKDSALRCGLNDCGTIHWHGYVIRTKSGVETHCGKDCGKREFGVEFESVEATFRQALDYQQRRDWLAEIATKRDELVLEANRLIRSLDTSTKRIDTVLSDIEKDAQLRVSFWDAIRSNGAIRTIERVSDETAQALGIGRSDRERFVTVAQLDGSSALLAEAGKGYAAKQALLELKGRTAPFLNGLTDESLLGLRPKAQRERSQEIDGHLSRIKRAHGVAQQAELFVQPQNLQKLHLLSGTSGRADRIRRRYQGLQGG